MSDQIPETNEIQELDQELSALLDGELSEDRAHALRSRMQREPAVAARFEALSAPGEALRALAAESPAPERMAGMRAEMQRRLDEAGAIGSASDQLHGAAGEPPAATVIPLRRHVRWMAPLGAALAAGVTLYLSLAPSPVEPPASLDVASDEDIAIALEYEVLADYEVIEQLEVLELLAAMDPPM